MDGLSAAASGIAVVSLAIQLVDSVRDIQRFLHRVSDAPKELKRLLDLLEQLELILESIGMIIERQNTHEPDHDAAVSASVLRALKTCENKLLMLEDVVEVAKKASGGGRVARSFGAFRLACKTRDVEEFEGQLQHAINILNLTMTVNLTVAHSQSTRRILDNMTASAKKPLLTAASDDMEKYTKVVSNRFQGKRFPAKDTSVSHWSTATLHQYPTPFGTFHLRHILSSTRLASEKPTPSTITSSEKTLTFSPSFLSRCIEMRYSSTFGVVSRSFRTYPVLPENHLVIEIYYSRDITSLQEYFGRGVSPFSTDIYGRGLLHIAVSYRQIDVCRLLIQLGSRVDATDNYGIPTYYGIFSGSNKRPIVDLVRLIFPQNMDNDIAESWPGLFRYASPHYFQNFVRVMNELVTAENINVFQTSPLLAVVESLSWAAITPTTLSLDLWRYIIRKLVNLGANIHHFSNMSPHTLLDRVLLFGNDTFGSKSVAAVWLDGLRDAGIDLTAYLDTESKIHSGTPPLIQDNWVRKRQLKFSYDPPSISWEWWTDPEGCAYALLEEFKNFNSPEVVHKKWNLDPETECWPYTTTYSHCCDFKVECGDVTTLAERDVARLAKERFQRRQLKKNLKLAKIQGLLGGPKLPGSWVD